MFEVKKSLITISMSCSSVIRSWKWRQLIFHWQQMPKFEYTLPLNILYSKICKKNKNFWFTDNILYQWCGRFITVFWLILHLFSSELRIMDCSPVVLLWQLTTKISTLAVCHNLVVCQINNVTYSVNLVIKMNQFSLFFFQQHAFPFSSN